MQSHVINVGTPFGAGLRSADTGSPARHQDRQRTERDVQERRSAIFQVTGRGGVPANATAVTGNLTVTGQTSSGYLFMGPTASATPASSTLNFPRSDNRANGVTVKLSPTGKLGVVFIGFGAATTHVIFDVTGYFLNDDPNAPDRLDIRAPCSGTGARYTSPDRTFREVRSSRPADVLHHRLRRRTRRGRPR